MLANFASAIYSGKIRHRRFAPTSHQFEYNVFMMYLDLDEIDKIFSMSRLWSMRYFSPVRFNRNDFHISNTNDHQTSLSIKDSVRATVKEKTGHTLNGPIRMLVNLRYWGVSINPLSTYYCFDDNGENIVAIVAEVHNTPWNQRHSYVLLNEGSSNKQDFSFHKAFHVSPFNPMDMNYKWTSTTPSENILIHLENWLKKEKVMDATLKLQRTEITNSSLNRIIIRFPWMTVKVIASIYWQALLLWWKRAPIFDHPKSS